MDNKQATYQFTTSQKIYLPFKRLIGIFGSIVGIVVCLVLLWWWVIPVNAIVTKGHPFFNRHRIGKDGKPFICLKLRTMKLDTDPHMSSTHGDRSSHLTKFGKFLRKTSIDETVQLFNILVGQMAFIGPRPLIDVNEEDVTTINKRKENGAIFLKPGIGGWAQIHKRERLDPKEKAQYDYEYLTRVSFLLDIKIFVYTILMAIGFVKGR
jgi:O-antigen biosynthesis protein WbqP